MRPLHLSVFSYSNKTMTFLHLLYNVKLLHKATANYTPVYNDKPSRLGICLKSKKLWKYNHAKLFETKI